MSIKELLSQVPDMVVSKNVVVTADIKFHRLLRIEGVVEGKVIAPPEACLVLCTGGTFKGHLKGLGLVYINGIVEGDISVYRLSLGPKAEVTGNILCQEIEISSQAKLKGNLKVSPAAQIPNDDGIQIMQDMIQDSF